MVRAMAASLQRALQEQDGRARGTEGQRWGEVHSPRLCGSKAHTCHTAYPAGAPKHP